MSRKILIAFSEFASDIKDVYPEKHVTLLHSRSRLLPRFDPLMHNESKALSFHHIHLLHNLHQSRAASKISESNSSSQPVSISPPSPNTVNKPQTIITPEQSAPQQAERSQPTSFYSVPVKHLIQIFLKNSLRRLLMLLDMRKLIEHFN